MPTDVLFDTPNRGIETSYNKMEKNHVELIPISLRTCNFHICFSFHDHSITPHLPTVTTHRKRSITDTTFMKVVASKVQQLLKYLPNFLRTP